MTQFDFRASLSDGTHTFSEQDIVAASSSSTSQHGPEVARVSDVVAYQGQRHRMMSVCESHS